MDLSILSGHRSKFLNFNIFLSQKIGFIFANSADPDEMLHYAAFHLGHHCLPKYLLTGVSRMKRVKAFKNDVKGFKKFLSQCIVRKVSL